MTIQQHASFDSSAAELNATSKLVKAWESKNAKNAAKAGGISLMALSLAACGGSSTTTTTPVVETPVVDTPVVDAAVALTLTKSAVTGGLDSLAGGSGDDTFTAGADGYLETGDVIDGGAGTDTVTGRFTANSQTVDPTLTNVEVVNVRVDGVDQKAFTFNGGDVTSAIWLRDATAVSPSSNDELVTFDALVLGTAVGIEHGESDVELTAVFAATTGTSDSATLNLQDATANIVTVDAIETLNVVSTAADASVITSLVADNAKTVNISGAGKVTLSATDFAATVTINAADAAGGVVITGDTSSKITFTGSSVADSFDVGALSELATGDLLTGGAGEDRLVSSDTAISTSEATAIETYVEGFEVYAFDGVTEANFDMFDDLAEIDRLELAASGNTASTAPEATGGTAGADHIDVSGVENSDTIIVTAVIEGQDGQDSLVTGNISGGAGGDAIDVDPELDSSDNTVNIVLEASVFGGDAGSVMGTTGSTALTGTGAGGAGGDAIDAAPFEMVNISTRGDETSLELTGGAKGTDGHTSGSGDGAEGASIRVATGGEIVLTGAIDINLGTVVGTNFKLSASEYTGDITIVGEAGLNTIVTGSGDDTITGGAGVDTITTGAGADTIIIGLENAATDSDATAEGASGAAGSAAGIFESVTDFDVANDTLSFVLPDDTAATLAITENGTATTGNALVDAEGIASFAAADDTVAEKITAVEASFTHGNGKMVVFEHGGNSYVFVSDATDGVNDGDIVIELTGVTDITSTTLDGGSLTFL